MKKLTNLLITVLFLQVGCTNLDLNPLSEGSSQSWYSNQTEVELSVNYLYFWRFWDIDPDPNNFGNMGWRDSWTDDWTNRNIVSPFANGTLNPQADYVTSYWRIYYTCIAASNNLISKLESTSAGLTESKIKEYLANARFARAAQYSKLIFHWGDVPYLDKTLTIEEAFKLGRTKKEKILETIYDDFDYAAEHLPLSYTSAQNKRGTKGAALALKARIALYMHDYEAASNAAKACIDLQVYKLNDDFSSQFYSASKNSAESIFTIPRSVELNLYTPAAITQQPLPRNAGGNSYFWPSWDLFCSFLCIDGLPIDESRLYNPQRPFENRDPRCNASIVPFGTDWGGYIYQPHPDSLTTLRTTTGTKVSNNDSRGIIQWASWNGLIWRKRIDNDWYGDFLTDPDHIVIRYADVLLIYAEASIELNQITELTMSAMNQVRARAYKTAPSEINKYPTIPLASQSALRRVLRIERRMEFAFEGLRYNDIIRWKLAEKVLNKPIYGMIDPEDQREKIVKPGLWFFPEVTPIDEDGISDFDPMFRKGYVKILALRSFDKEKHYLWPIPANEIVINKNIVQNPRY
ncbi:MAG: RagB/SusD family nutrient uptake outer membrane protein [Janthinobacterium sp.]|jgi:hypothetical protein